ncbi:hypothetical protein OIU85_028452 [Salix viminalis]|uniref:Uncharacterized protein n=1 Tax=Salix viminalis TaxID=40686 RepID=A0A9Q0QKI3_SALVM|nr:hypothetical protein OIU85_028452 [Salix viminalis]
MIRLVKKKLRRNKIVAQQTGNDLSVSSNETTRNLEQARGEKTVTEMNSLKDQVAILWKAVEIQSLKDQICLRDAKIQELEDKLYLRDAEIQRLKKINDSDKKEETQRLKKMIQSANVAYDGICKALTTAENGSTSPKEMAMVEKKIGEEDIIGAEASCICKALTTAENGFTSPEEMPMVEKKIGEEEIIGAEASCICKALTTAENGFTSPKEMPMVEKKIGEEDIIGAEASC